MRRTDIYRSTSAVLRDLELAVTDAFRLPRATSPRPGQSVTIRRVGVGFSRLPGEKRRGDAPDEFAPAAYNPAGAMQFTSGTRLGPYEAK